MLHVCKDGSLAATKRAPLTEMQEADSFQSHVVNKLRSYCVKVGSETRIKGASFSRSSGPLSVRVTIDVAQKPSAETKLVIAGMCSDDDVAGHGWFPDEDITYHGSDRVFFHGTTVFNAVHILDSGTVVVNESQCPIGHYTTLQPHAFYDKGAVVECTCAGLLCSARESKVIMSREPPVVPEGYICFVKRSCKEYVMNPKSINIIAITFTMESLEVVLGDSFDYVPVPASIPPKRNTKAGSKAKALAAPKAQFIQQLGMSSSSSSAPPQTGMASSLRSTHRVAEGGVLRGVWFKPQTQRLRSRSAPRTPRPPEDSEDQTWGEWNA